jgi:phospholipid-binding lipoprotein MlaA
MRNSFRPAVRTLLLVALVMLASACVRKEAAGVPDGIVDPYETENRAVHQLNLGLDQYVVRPMSKGYAAVVPDPIEDSVGYFADNLALPGMTLDFLLQARFREAGIAVSRFLINSTVGFAGLANPASEAFNIPEVDTDFGEVLFSWGMDEGAYLELPVLGPSTQRDAIGVIGNLLTNPLTFAIQNPFANVGIYAEGGRRLTDRARFSDTVDSILYDSADSYAQSRLIYLQNRRFELGDTGAQTDADPYVDPYSDPYELLSEDPYDIVAE